eukprot:gnl/TRDRNA2_/TRDRNA2_171637_c0_seq2.p2 gnl/TRDRNA2_/TRDRNA2_171637_c0~~gnl/TRDRNA2_/TRDRNA2_171637_c0_seq2.p2  ORF type:complete len:125 (+),score=25.65 gnl/TRDRNA2_/TRDRNA2_171637_c0_seq2:658-1032(+)
MLTSMPTDTDEQVAAAAAKVIQMGAQKVLVTIGDRGCALFEGEKPGLFVPAKKVQAKDTTGAGDSFLGALVHYLTLGSELATACALANKVAAVSVTREGTQLSFPDSNDGMLLALSDESSQRVH